MVDLGKATLYSLQSVAVFITMLMNGCIVLSVLLVDKLKDSKVNFLIATLSSTNMVFCVPFLWQVFTNVNTSPLACSISMVLIVWSSGCAMYCRAAIAFDRYVFITDPLRYYQRMNGGMQYYVLMGVIFVTGISAAQMHIYMIRVPFRIYKDYSIPADQGGLNPPELNDTVNTVNSASVDAKWSQKLFADDDRVQTAVQPFVSSTVGPYRRSAEETNQQTTHQFKPIRARRRKRTKIWRQIPPTESGGSLRETIQQWRPSRADNSSWRQTSPAHGGTKSQTRIHRNVRWLRRPMRNEAQGPTSHTWRRQLGKAPGTSWLRPLSNGEELRQTGSRSEDKRDIEVEKMAAVSTSLSPHENFVMRDANSAKVSLHSGHTDQIMSVPGDPIQSSLSQNHRGENKLKLSSEFHQSEHIPRKLRNENITDFKFTNHLLRVLSKSRREKRQDVRTKGSNVQPQLYLPRNIFRSRNSLSKGGRILKSKEAIVSEMSRHTRQVVRGDEVEFGSLPPIDHSFEARDSIKSDSWRVPKYVPEKEHAYEGFLKEVRRPFCDIDAIRRLSVFSWIPLVVVPSGAIVYFYTSVLFWAIKTIRVVRKEEFSSARRQSRHTRMFTEKEDTSKDFDRSTLIKTQIDSQFGALLFPDTPGYIVPPSQPGSPGSNFGSADSAVSTAGNGDPVWFDKSMRSYSFAIQPHPPTAKPSKVVTSPPQTASLAPIESTPKQQSVTFPESSHLSKAPQVTGSAHTVHSVHTANPAHTVHSVHTVNTAHSVHSVHTVNPAHSVHSVYNRNGIGASKIESKSKVNTAATPSKISHRSRHSSDALTGKQLSITSNERRSEVGQSVAFTPSTTNHKADPKKQETNKGGVQVPSVDDSRRLSTAVDLGDGNEAVTEEHCASGDDATDYACCCLSWLPWLRHPRCSEECARCCLTVFCGWRNWLIELKAALTTLIIITGHVALWLPLVVSLILDTHGLYYSSNEAITTYSWIAYCTTTLDPIIYCVFNRPFRMVVKYMIKCP